jgi:hypothetical protein
MVSSDQGVAATTGRSGDLAPVVLQCQNDPQILNNDVAVDLFHDPGKFVDECSPRDPKDTAAGMSSKSLVALPSYGLNALTAVGDSGVAWAVGDHGAILRLHGSRGGLREPDAG